MKPDWQLRVIQESAELDLKLKKLEEFITTNSGFKDLNLFEQTRLRDQRHHMAEYSKILHERMVHFNV